MEETRAIFVLIVAISSIYVVNEHHKLCGFELKGAILSLEKYVIKFNNFYFRSIPLIEQGKQTMRFSHACNDLLLMLSWFDELVC